MNLDNIIDTKGGHRFILRDKTMGEPIFCIRCRAPASTVISGDKDVGVAMDPSKEKCGPARVESVNHPSHYNSHPSGIECITIVEHFNFNIGNAVKYLWRAGLKGDAVEDLKKAAFYCNREAERLEKARKP